MKTEQLANAMRLFGGAHCLWIGAGLGLHLGREAGVAIPDWNGFVDAIVREAGLSLAGIDGLSAAEKTGAALRALGRERFQAKVYELIELPTARAVVALAEKHVGTENPVPPVQEAFARLAAYSTPIVSFNVEALTARMLNGSTSYSQRAFQSPLVGDDGLRHGVSSMQANGVVRPLLHPHGLLEQGGICVLSESEYQSLNGTMALRVATHSAFRTNLIIIGMSLEDAYLRNQLTEFRSQILDILWFTDKVPGHLKRWTTITDVTVVESPWSEFWSAVGQLETRQDPKNCFLAWKRVVDRAWSVIDAASKARHDLELLASMSRPGDEANMRAALDQWARAARSRGVEPFAAEPLHMSSEHLDLTGRMLADYNRLFRSGD